MDAYGRQATDADACSAVIWDTIDPDEYASPSSATTADAGAPASNDDDGTITGDDSVTVFTPRELIYQWWTKTQAAEAHIQEQAAVPWGSLSLYPLESSNQDDLYTIPAIHWVQRFSEYCAILFYSIDDDSSTIKVFGLVSIVWLKKLLGSDPNSRDNAHSFLRRTTWLPRDWVDMRTGCFIQAGKNQRVHDCSVAIDQLETPGTLPTGNRISALINERLPAFEVLVIELDQLIQKHERAGTHRMQEYWSDVMALVKTKYLHGMDFSLVEHRVLDYCLRRHMLYYILSIEPDVVWRRLAEIAAHLLQSIITICWPHEHLVVEFLKSSNMHSWMINLSAPGNPNVHQALTGWSAAWKMTTSFRIAVLNMFAASKSSGSGGSTPPPSKKRALLKASDSVAITPVSSRFITGKTREDCLERYNQAIQQAIHHESLTLSLDNDEEHEYWTNPLVPLCQRLKAPSVPRIIATMKPKGIRVWALHSYENLRDLELEDSSMQQVMYDYLPTKMYFVYKQLPPEERQQLRERLQKAVKDYVIGTREFTTSCSDDQLDVMLSDYRQYQTAGGAEEELTVCVFNSLIFKSLVQVRTLLFQGDAIRFVPDTQRIVRERYLNHSSIGVPFECLLQPDLAHLQPAYEWYQRQMLPPQAAPLVVDTQDISADLNAVLKEFLHRYPNREPPRFLWTRPKHYFDANPSGENRGLHEINYSGVAMYLLSYLDMPFFLASRLRYYLHTVKDSLRTNHDNSLRSLLGENEGEFNLCDKVGQRFTALYLKTNPTSCCSSSPSGSLVGSCAEMDSSEEISSQPHNNNGGGPRRSSSMVMVEDTVQQRKDGILERQTVAAAQPAPIKSSSGGGKKRPYDSKEAEASEKQAKHRKNLRDYATAHFEDYGIFLMGEPSGRGDCALNYGTKGSIKLTFKGEWKSSWIDFEHGINGKGSYTLTLYQIYSEENGGHFQASMCNKNGSKKKAEPKVVTTKSGHTYTVYDKPPWQQQAEKLITVDKIYERLERFYRGKVSPEDYGKYLRDNNSTPIETSAKALERFKKLVEKSKEAVKALYEGTTPLTGTLGAEYLRKTRGISCISTHVLEESPFIRFHSALQYFHQRDPTTGAKRHYDMPPAVIFFATNADHELVGCQRIYLDKSTKNKLLFENQLIDPPKRSMGKLRECNGFVCVQYGRLDMLPCIWIAEGPETATSVAAASPYMRVYTALGIGNFYRFNFDLQVRAQDSPTGISSPVLCLCLDRDPPKKRDNNRKTIDSAIQELRETGWTVIEAIPEQCDEQTSGLKVDFNDVLKLRGVDRLRELLRVPREACIAWFDESPKADDEQEDEDEEEEDEEALRPPQEREQDPDTFWPRPGQVWQNPCTALCDPDRVEILRK